MLANSTATTIPMSITKKNADEIDGMRLAGRLAAEVLDFITPASGPA